MVLALLNESDLVLSDDMIESIVDKVHNILPSYLRLLHFKAYWKISVS